MKGKKRKIKMVVNLAHSYAQIEDAMLSNINQLPGANDGGEENVTDIFDDGGHNRIGDKLLSESLNAGSIKARLRIIISGQNSTDVVIELEDEVASIRDKALDIEVLRLLALRIFKEFFKDYL